MNSIVPKKVVYAITALIVVLFVVTIISKTQVKEEDMTEEQRAEMVLQEQEIETIKDLSGMTERDRIESYFVRFIKHIDNGRYSEAYKLLNEDFKTKYFPTKVSFEEYAKSHFPNEIALEYNNIERNGNIYVLWVTIQNALTGDTMSGKDINVVIKEHAVNDFEMSFSVEVETKEE